MMLLTSIIAFVSANEIADILVDQEKYPDAKGLTKINVRNILWSQDSVDATFRETDKTIISTMQAIKSKKKIPHIVVVRAKEQDKYVVVDGN